MKSNKMRLSLLRNAMKGNGIDFYIIPSSDPHLGEYIPDHWKIIQWLTGFTGSSATLVITYSFAGLWTDSRYFIQAEKQLSDSGFELVRSDRSLGNNYPEFIFENARQGDKVGFDGRILSLAQFRRLKLKLENKKLTFLTNCDLISELWDKRPELPFSLAFDHPVRFAGKEREVKINEVRMRMKNENTDYHLITSNDDIMWLLNIRGNDLQYSPLLLSYALISKKQICLFIDKSKIPTNLATEFERLGILIFPYTGINELKSFIAEGSSVQIDPLYTSVFIHSLLSGELKIFESSSIPSQLKAVKNSTEIENIYRVMIKDGVALTKFLYWFDSTHDKAFMNENSLSQRLLEFRFQQEEFLGPSFPAIIAFNENSALPHYLPEDNSGKEIGERGVLLLDSGGQYMGGTTDITRTIPVGIPSDKQINDFTHILKGHINLALAKFPAGTKGYQLDILARKAMWKSGLNYGHGTGHGVGYCLNVHEGPQSISPYENRKDIEAGMLISNEPAIYREKEYGIRIENLILCYEDEETEFGQFLCFDTVSLCYIEKAMINKSMLYQKEVEWLNSYNSEVYNKLLPYLSDEERDWLKGKTDPL